MNKDAMLLYSNNKICSTHFDANLVTNHYLSKNAIPTLNLFQKPRGIDVQTQTEDKMGTEGKRVAHIETQTTKELSHQTPRKRKLRHLIEITNADFRRNDLPSKNVEHYISGYLLRKCLKKHSCLICEEYSRSNQILDSTNLFSHFKGDAIKYGRGGGNYGKLLSPEDSFVLEVTRPCPEFPQLYLIHLFIRMRIYYITKYANRNFQSAESNKRKNNKSRKLQILNHK
ncbi:uncharacterized protein LOC123675295 [Harmonia axyridis]|uniref:uncharacterized protein LOC123675295 n=1 Tax=Harmonia axyridis TaxID=115357 RepID=UPI001E2768F7|nr:uncharacterized protein LOC123675295 [Harmonia axyridis]